MLICTALTACSIYTGNGASMDLLVYGIPAVFGELAIHTGFIIHKARVENIKKHELDTNQIIEIE